MRILIMNAIMFVLKMYYRKINLRYIFSPKKHDRRHVFVDKPFQTLHINMCKLYLIKKEINYLPKFKHHFLQTSHLA